MRLRPLLLRAAVASSAVSTAAKAADASTTSSSSSSSTSTSTTTTSSQQSPANAFFVARLANLVTSHGELSPLFDPVQVSYELDLHDAEVDVLSLSTSIKRSGSGDDGSSNIYGTPEIVIEYPGKEDNGKPESSYKNVKSDIDLPDDGSPVTVKITVRDSQAPKVATQYSIRVKGGSPIAALRAITVTDDLGARIPTKPFVSSDQATYDLYVNPEAKSLTVKVTCATGNSAVAAGKSVAEKGSISVAREVSHHRQLIPVECRAGNGAVARHMLQVSSEFAAADIPKPKVTVGGQDCEMTGSAYKCPDPKTEDGTTSLLASLDPSIRYTIESKDVQVRVLDGQKSIKFPYGKGSYTLKALAGSQSTSWPIDFGGSRAGKVLKIAGVILGGILVALLAALLCVLGVTSLGSIGTPIGVTEVAGALACLLQFFSFSSSTQKDDNNLLKQMNSALQWVTFYWPLPFSLDGGNAKTAGARRLLTEAASSGGGTTSPAKGNVNLAYGCLFWTSCILGILILFHVFTICKRKIANPRSTFPHRLRFGNWESRALHFLSFPMAVAAGHILVTDRSDSLSDTANTVGKVLAAFVLTLLGVFALVSGVVICNAVTSQKVTWVWGSSVHEDGVLESEAGYWSDVRCDQLLTHPVNRSCCRSLFPWMWVSTVADIDPVEICSEEAAFKRHRGETYGPALFNDDDGGDGKVQAKAPRTVDVVKAVPTNCCCPGSRLICGLLQLNWLDLLLTYDGLTTLFQKSIVEAHDNSSTVPMLVKTCQLTGPTTGGSAHFFWDGTRWPFARVADVLYRLLAGVLVGVGMAVSKDNSALGTGCFISLGILTLGYLLWVAIRRPYARCAENWVLVTSLVALMFAALGMTISRLLGHVDWLETLCLWATAAFAVLLAAYAAFVLFTLLSSLLCPALEEVRFLERLANSSVKLADHDGGWSVKVPAYCKPGTKSVRAQAIMTGDKRVNVSVFPTGEHGTLEMDPMDLLGACQSGQIAKPLLSVTTPDNNDSLGYRHANVYDSPQADIAGFLAMSRETRHVADSIARSVVRQLRTGDKAVIALDVMPNA